MKKYIKSSIGLDTSDWGSVRDALSAECQRFSDPLTMNTDVGMHIEGICQDVESELGVWFELSPQDETTFIIQSTDGSTAYGSIDRYRHDCTVIDDVLRSETQEEFIARYRRYVSRIIQ